MRESIDCRVTDILADKERYRPYVLSSADFLLNKPLQINSQLIAVEANLGGQILGLLVVQLFVPQRTAQLYSLFVVENQRRKGIGLFLFKCIEEYLIGSLQCTAMGFEYKEGSPFNKAIEKILFHRGWEPPRLYLIRCFFDSSFNPPWYQAYLNLPLLPDMEIFPWEQLKSEEKNRILFEAEQGHFFPYLSPFHLKAPIESLNSLGLRYRNQVIGWCITHRTAPDTIRYSSLYIQKNFHFSKYGLALLARSIKIHKDSPFTKGVFETNYEETEPTWWRFILKRLAPFASHVEKIKWALKVY